MNVVFYGNVIEYTNGEKSYESGQCQSLRGLIDELGVCYGESFKDFLLGSETCFFLVNAASTMFTGGLDSPLKQGDKIEILPFVGAG